MGNLCPWGYLLEDLVVIMVPGLVPELRWGMNYADKAGIHERRLMYYQILGSGIVTL